MSFTCNFCKVNLSGELSLTERAGNSKIMGLSITVKKLKITFVDLLERSLWIHVNLSMLIYT